MIMKTTENIEFWAFVKNPVELKTPVSLCDGKTVKEWLKEKFSSIANFGVDNLQCGFFRIGGWCFDLRPFMNRYIYTSYGSIFVCYAPSVKGLRETKALRRCERVTLAPEGF